jgi:hypothetical protein
MKLIRIAYLFTLVASIASADTLELANGTVLEGDFVDSSNGIIMFDTGNGIEAFPEDQVVGLYFSSGVAAATQEAGEEDATITVAAGTRLMIRTSDPVDTSRHQTGHRFRGQLEGALVVDGVTVAPRGSYIHGVIADANQAGRVAGTSELEMRFTDIMIDDQLFPIETTSMVAEGNQEAGSTVGRTARAAAIGGMIGGRSGARTGAQVGVGVSLVTRGASINVPAGTLLETSLSAPLVLVP